MKNKYLLWLLGFTFIALIVFSINPIQERKKVLDCNSPPDIFYLKPNEISHIQEILKDPQAVVVIPELNRIQANTELLSCNNLDLNKYLDLGGFR